MDYNTCLFSYQRIMLKNLYLFFILHQIHCFLFQFDSSLFFIMQILINVWYVCVNKQWTVNIHLIFYRLLQQTILTSVHNSKPQWIDYPFVNDYSKENITCYLVALILYSLRILILNSFFSTRFILHISNKNSRQYLIPSNTYSKKRLYNFCSG